MTSSVWIEHGTAFDDFKLINILFVSFLLDADRFSNFAVAETCRPKSSDFLTLSRHFTRSRCSFLLEGDGVRRSTMVKGPRHYRDERVRGWGFLDCGREAFGRLADAASRRCVSHNFECTSRCAPKQRTIIARAPGQARCLLGADRLDSPSRGRAQLAMRVVSALWNGKMNRLCAMTLPVPAILACGQEPAAWRRPWPVPATR
jgi:hypothetical protein